ncbi:MAG TPA: LLM class flavin-dependent oxidoreductase [Kofleriaceae bacterium]
MALEIGLDTFGDRTVNADGSLKSHAQAMRDLVDQAVLADQVGLAFIGVGEHHRDDFAVSAPEVVLAGIATRTKNIRLGSAVTVLSTDDPIRVFQRFSTVDALSNGRAEIIVGRGSFTESFPLFGLPLENYNELFEEKIEKLAAIVHGDTKVYPPIEKGQLRVWVGVGGTPQSVVRAAAYGFPLMLAIIGGEPARFTQFVDLYYRALRELKQPILPVGCHSPGHVAETDEKAREDLWKHFLEQRTKIGAERGWPPPARAQFDRECGPEGAIFVGSPETVAQKIATTAKTLNLTRFDLKYSNGTMPHETMMKSIELIGTKVMPRVHELLGDWTPGETPNR